MMVSNLLPFVMQVVVFISEPLGYSDLYFNIGLIVLVPVLAFSGTVLDERVRARDGTPAIEIFQAMKYCFQTYRGSLR